MIAGTGCNNGRRLCVWGTATAALSFGAPVAAARVTHEGLQGMDRHEPHRAGPSGEPDVPVVHGRGGPHAGGPVPHPRYEEPALVFEPPPPRSPRDFSILKDVGLVLFLVAAVVAGLLTWQVVGRATQEALARPSAPASLSPSPASPAASASGGIAVPASPAASAPASASPAPSPTATPKPKPKPVRVNVVAKPKAVFVSEGEKTWCAAAAVQIVLNANSDDPDTSYARQARIHRLQVAATTRSDSRNGGVGPEGMVAVLNRLGKVDYELRVYGSRRAALVGAAKAISRTGHPAILLAWRGAHAWVMSGYRATADPLQFKKATVKGAYILDPWYPRVSSIWGRSDGPGVYQDAAEMRRNFLPWRRPEGKYPGRDGRFLVIVPVSR